VHRASKSESGVSRKGNWHKEMIKDLGTLGKNLRDQEACNKTPKEANLETISLEKK
jgi:hypothetical protein